MRGLKEILLRRMTPEQMADELVRVQKENIKLHEENLRLKVENFWLALGKPEPTEESENRNEETKG